MESKFRTNTGLFSEKDALITGVLSLQRTGNTGEFQSGLIQGTDRLPSQEVEDPQVVFKALDKTSGVTTIKSAFVIKFFNEVASGQPENASYFIKNPAGTFSIRYDWDDKLGYRIIDQKFGDSRYITRQEMSGYTKLNYVNSGWVNADRGFYALPTYGLKFAPLGVDGQVDTEQAFQNFYGVQTTDEQNLTYDVAAETANTVYLKTVNSVLSLQSTVVSAGATIHPENRPRNIPVTQPKFGEIPKFTSTMPELAQEEIDDGAIYSSDFLGMYPFYYGNEIQDTTNVTLADNTNMVAPYNKTGYTFGGQILFHPTVSNDISDRSISPEKPWVKVYTSEQQRSWATLKNSARKSGLMTPVGSVYKGSFNPVSVWKISDPVMGYGGKKTQPHHNQPAIDKPFYNKGVEFYTQTQSSDASNVEAGTGYGWQYEIDRVDGLNLRYAIAGKKMLMEIQFQAGQH